MRRINWFGQAMALFAAAVIVLTGFYIYILWRNQSPSRVLTNAGGQLVYQTTDVAIGTIHKNHVTNVNVMRFTPDGGWVIAGSGQWIQSPQLAGLANVAIIDNSTVGPIGAGWICATQLSQRVTDIVLIPAHHVAPADDYSFHQGGIVEPIILRDAYTVEGWAGKTLLFRFHYAPASQPR